MALQYALTTSVTTTEGNEETVTYGKEQLGSKSIETKILGVCLNKQNDTQGVDFKPCKYDINSDVTKRSILRPMTSVYDPLGVILPMLLVGKQLYRTTCNKKTAWDNYQKILK